MISVIVALIVAGVLVWLFNSLVPMDARFKMVINALIGLFLLLYVLNALGIWSGGAKLLS